jgi:hypothetical protein
MQDSLQSLALKLGVLIASSLLEDEVTRLCGRRSERQPGSAAGIESSGPAGRARAGQPRLCRFTHLAML